MEVFILALMHSVRADGGVHMYKTNSCTCMSIAHQDCYKLALVNIVQLHQQRHVSVNTNKLE